MLEILDQGILRRGHRLFLPNEREHVGRAGGLGFLGVNRIKKKRIWHVMLAR